jgi:hypothetical protein
MALEALVCFASKNPGVDPENYNGQMEAMRSDQSRSFRGWCRVKEAAVQADRIGVTDDDLLAASVDTRITLTLVQEEGGAPYYAVRYLAGQYYPTEFRHGVATVIEYATHHRLKILRCAFEETVRKDRTEANSNV